MDDLIIIYLQEIKKEMHSTRFMFKTNYYCESYLEAIYYRKYTTTLSNFKSGVMDITIENVILNDIPRDQRLCILCNTNNI